MCKISKDLLKTLTYNFSNVKKGGIIKQFIFTEDTTEEEAREFMKEYFPEGFNSWYQYNRHIEKVEKIKYRVHGILCIVVFCAIALDIYIQNMGM